MCPAYSSSEENLEESWESNVSKDTGGRSFVETEHSSVSSFFSKAVKGLKKVWVEIVSEKRELRFKLLDFFWVILR